MRALLSDAPDIRTLLLRNDNVPSYFLRLIAQFCPRLTSLSLACFSLLADADLSLIAGSCPDLHRLALDRCVSITSAGLAVVAARCSRLEDFGLSDHYFLDDAAAHVIRARLAPRLRTLDLGGCVGIGRAALLGALRSCTLLERLTLDGCNVTDDTVAAVSPQLRVLSLKRCIGVSPVGLAAVSRRCRWLTDLNIFGLRATTDAAIASLARSCPLLEALDMSWCLAVTDVGLGWLEGCRRLRRLLLSGCDKLSGSTIANVVAGTPGMAYLDISWTTVDDRGVDRLANAAPQLGTMHINWCRFVTNDTVYRLAQLAHSHRLRTLFAVGCHFEDNQPALRAAFPAGSVLYFQ